MAGAEHPHDGQQPVTLDVAAMNPQEQEGLSQMSETQTRTLADLKDLAVAAGRAERQAEASSRSATRLAAPTPPAAARTPSPASGSSPARARSWSTASGSAPYFARPVLRMLITQPFLVADRYNQFDVFCTVNGGGLSGQAGALRHGISRALTYYEPDLRGILKVAGFLTRDSRVVERKKYGRAKARRSFQFSKR